MNKILKLYLDDQKKDESLTLYTTAQSLEQTGILSEIKIFYESKNSSKMIARDSFQEFDTLLTDLKSVLDQKLLLHESIIKNIGYYWNRYLKKQTAKIWFIQRMNVVFFGLGENINYLILQ